MNQIKSIDDAMTRWMVVVVNARRILPNARVRTDDPLCLRVPSSVPSVSDARQNATGERDRRDAFQLQFKSVVVVSCAGPGRDVIAGVVPGSAGSGSED